MGGETFQGVKVHRYRRPDGGKLGYGVTLCSCLLRTDGSCLKNLEMGKCILAHNGMTVLIGKLHTPNNNSRSNMHI